MLLALSPALLALSPPPPVPVDIAQTYPVDTSGIENLDWGELQIGFGSEGGGEVWFESLFENYGSGNYPIERLARPMLAECELPEDE